MILKWPKPPLILVLNVIFSFPRKQKMLGNYIRQVLSFADFIIFRFYFSVSQFPPKGVNPQLPEVDLYKKYWHLFNNQSDFSHVMAPYSVYIPALKLDTVQNTVKCGKK